MKYFQILNCSKEPFPGQPLPEIFFPTVPQDACISSFFTAVQSGRHSAFALIGEAGSGKTTILQQLNKRFSKEIPDAVIVIASKPWFTSKKIFLERLTETMGISLNGNQTSNSLLGETKKFLSQTPNAGHKQVIILFDQAEQIPSYCLEILEDIFSEKIAPGNIKFIFFAAPILINKLSHYLNLSISTSIHYIPKKLGFHDAKGLLSYYLNQSGTTRSLNSLVTTPGQLFLYLVSGGNPGKILDLFRLTLINQIIQDRSKAGAILCYQAAKEIYPESIHKFEKIKIASLAAITLALVVLVNGTDRHLAPRQAESTKQTAEKVYSVDVSKITPPKEAKDEPAEPAGEISPLDSDTPISEVSSKLHVVDILKSLQNEGEKEKDAEQVTQSLTEEVKKGLATEDKTLIAKKEITQKEQFEEAKTFESPAKEEPKTIVIATIQKETEEAKSHNLPTITNQSNKVSKTVKPETEVGKRKITAAEDIAEIKPEKEKTQDILGKIKVPKNATFGHIIRAVYGKGSVTNANISWLMKINPQITDPNNVRPGTLIKFPVKAVRLPKNSSGSWWIKLETFDTLQDAYSFLFKNTPGKPWIIIIPTAEKQPRNFMALVEESFANEKSANEKMSQLKRDGFSNSNLVHGLNAANSYFEEKK